MTPGTWTRAFGRRCRRRDPHLQINLGPAVTVTERLDTSVGWFTSAPTKTDRRDQRYHAPSNQSDTLAALLTCLICTRSAFRLPSSLLREL